MSRYYYLISSLPFLKAESEPPWRSEAFLTYCAGQVSPAVYRRLCALSEVPGEGATGELERKWYAFETALRNAAVQLRAQRTKREAATHLQAETAAFGYLAAAVSEAFAQHPLQLEKQLDRLRWRFLDDALAGHSFDFDVLAVYRLKLLLLEKRMHINAEEGSRQLDRFLDRKLTANQLPEFIHV